MPSHKRNNTYPMFPSVYSIPTILITANCLTSTTTMSYSCTRRSFEYLLIPFGGSLTKASRAVMPSKWGSTASGTLRNQTRDVESSRITVRVQVTRRETATSAISLTFESKLLSMWSLPAKSGPPSPQQPRKPMRAHQWVHDWTFQSSLLSHAPYKVEISGRNWVSRI